MGVCNKEKNILLFVCVCFLDIFFEINVKQNKGGIGMEKKSWCLYTRWNKDLTVKYFINRGKKNWNEVNIKKVIVLSWNKKKNNQNDKLGWFIEYGCYSINISRRNGGGKQNRIINMLYSSNKRKRWPVQRVLWNWDLNITNAQFNWFIVGNINIQDQALEAL